MKWSISSSYFLYFFIVSHIRNTVRLSPGIDKASPDASLQFSHCFVIYLHIARAIPSCLCNKEIQLWSDEYISIKGGLSNVQVKVKQILIKYRDIHSQLQQSIRE